MNRYEFAIWMATERQIPRNLGALEERFRMRNLWFNSFYFVEWSKQVNSNNSNSNNNK